MERILKPDVNYGRNKVFEDVPFFSSNHCFLNRLLREYGYHMREVLDIACGPGNVPVLLAKQRPDVKITAVDGSAELLDMARESARGLNINFVRGTIPGADLGTFDTIISKDFYHYLSDSAVFWNDVRRFSKEGTAIYVYGFIRPDTESEARDLVDKVMLYDDRLLKEDFFTSLCAGFTLDEVKEQVRDLGLDVVKTSQAHFLVKGRIRPVERCSQPYYN